LILSGIDPTGAAGFILDISIATSLGAVVYGVPTCLVAENYRTVSTLITVKGSFIEESINLAFEEGDFQATKIGLLPPGLLKPIVRLISTRRSSFGKIVVDPVLASTSGFSFYQKDFGVLKELLALADLSTPNLEEFYAIFKSKKKTPEEACAVSGIPILVTSYKRTNHYIQNLLIDNQKRKVFKTRRFPFEVRGTGCAFSTLIAFYLAQGEDIEKAIQKGMGKLKKLIETSKPLKGEKLRRIVVGN
jgi:hydroxymethylpyrimidine/phosphomethylpyrimidine kinase